MKKLTLGLCIVSTSTALAHNLEYKVCKGDTLSTIAGKFHVSGKAILHANDLMPSHHLRAGHFLMIPGRSEKPSLASKAAGVVPYTVRNGDHDWSLAMRNGLSVHALHAANPNVHWDHLKIGLTVRIPVSKKAHQSIHGASAETASVHMKAHWHIVERGENDWIIAHKAGIKLTLLKALNPEVNVSSIHQGQKVRVPGSAVAKMALHVAQIHSSHVAVKAASVSIRRKPGLGAGTIGTVDRGRQASVVDRDGNWYQLKFSSGTVGWVRGDYLKPIHVIELAQVEHHRRQADSHRAHIYAAAHKHPVAAHPALVAANKAAPAKAEHVGPTTLAAMDTAASDADGVLQKARSMRGVRYRWGAASRSATDCSGFTSQVFASNGIKLPRTSREQAKIGSKVPMDQLKPGDLVFFHTGRGHRITHVAIYKGNGHFFHASSGGGHVQENSLNEGYYHNRYSTARRILRHKPKPAEATPEASKTAVVAEAKPAEAKAQEAKVADPAPAPAATAEKTPSK